MSIAPRTEFQLIDLDEGRPGDDGVPVVRLFGVTDAGESVVLFVPGFRPYFYFPVTRLLSDDDATACADALRRQFPDLDFVEVRWRRPISTHPRVHSLTPPPRTTAVARLGQVHRVQREPLLYYRPDSGDRFRHFLRITVAQPRDVPRVVRYLERPETLPGILGADRCYDSQAYESNVAYPLRFMVDLGLVGGGWVHVLPGTATVVPASAEADAFAPCQWRAQCPAGAIVSHNDPVQIARDRARPDGDGLGTAWSRLAAGLRVLVLSVTSIVGADNGAHVAGVSCTCQRGGAAAAAAAGSGGWQTVAFARRGPGAALDARPEPNEALVVFPFGPDDEAALVQAWHAFFMQFDPDFVVGYEVSEHLALLLDRAEALGLRDAVSTLGRDTTEPARVRSAQIYSANWVRSQRRMASTSNHEFKVRP